MPQNNPANRTRTLEPPDPDWKLPAPAVKKVVTFCRIIWNVWQVLVILHCESKIRVFRQASVGFKGISWC